MGVRIESCSVTREWGRSPLSSPRGVEMHKPSHWKLHDVFQLGKFPSPRGVELHKLDMQRHFQRKGVLEVSVPSRG